MLLIGLLLSLGLARPAAGQESPELWGGLTPGPYAVGFRTLFRYDLSRPAVPYSDWEGRLYPTDETRGRQIQINVWYPGEVTPSNSRLTFGHYVDLMARQTDFSAITPAKVRFANEQFIAKTNRLGGNGSFTDKGLDVLRRMDSAAYDEPDSQSGKYPLIVFPNGGSPAFQSVMSEYFASHGFIVAATALKGQFAFSDDISVRGFETAVDDLGFVIDQVLRIEQVDAERICLIGNAITSTQIVAYQTRNERIDCLVSLDGGLLSQFEQRILEQTAYYEPHAINKPLLAIYAPHASIDPALIDHLRHSRQYRIHFPHMSEFHFLNYGAFEKFVPGIIGEASDNVGPGFELAAKYTLKFFEAYLQDKAASRKFLSTLTAESSVHIDSVVIRKGLASPPNVATLKDGFMNHGFEYVQGVYEDLKSENPTPFPRSYYADLSTWLGWGKDPEFENRYRLFQLALDSYPESAMVNFDLAYYALQTERNDVARRHSERTLELLESDQSRELTPRRIALMRRYALEDLEKLNEE